MEGELYRELVDAAAAALGLRSGLLMAEDMERRRATPSKYSDEASSSLTSLAVAPCSERTEEPEAAEVVNPL